MTEHPCRFNGPTFFEGMNSEKGIFISHLLPRAVQGTILPGVFWTSCSCDNFVLICDIGLN